jgi:hypothetical protein
MIERLKEYKEIITIVLFFLGGVFWIQRQYPTKNDLKSEIGSLQCLVDKYMYLTQLQIHSRYIERQAENLQGEIRAYGADEQGHLSISPAMVQIVEGKKAELGKLSTDLQKNNDDIQKTSDELQRNICGKAAQ